MIQTILQAIRIHQWVKNLLVFMPMVLAHQVLNLSAISQCINAFFAFSCIASAIYLTNDIFDIEADRKHPIKSKRPLPAGKISLPMAYALIAALSVCAILLSYNLNQKFLIVIILYACLTLLYSAWLKRIYVLDVMLLSLFYVLRIVAGAFAIDVIITNWLLAFSLFFFMSLALVKRHAEVSGLTQAADQTVPGRDYQYSDIHMLLILGPVSGLLSVLVLMLYIADQQILSKYTHPIWLWAVSVLLLYWITRIWFMANRRLIHSDPIIYALKDGPTYAIGFLALLCIFMAI